MLFERFAEHMGGMHDVAERKRRGDAPAFLGSGAGSVAEQAWLRACLALRIDGRSIRRYGRMLSAARLGPLCGLKTQSVLAGRGIDEHVAGQAASARGAGLDGRGV